jgi:predicted dehydrogenase
MQNAKNLDRRTFLRTAGAGTAIVATAPHVVRGAEPTGDPVRVGHIGTGTRGWGLIKDTGRLKSADVVAVCDVYKPHLQRGVEAAKNPDVKSYLDYRDLLSDPKVEAVVIATPDHWHQQMLTDAIHAGKDVYCEKGWTMSIEAAKKMREAVKKNNTVMQLGHQGRQYSAAKVGGDMIRDGELGPLTYIKTGRFTNSPAEKPVWRWYGNYSWFDRPDPKQVVKDLDWEKWLGPAENRDFNERHFWHWRCYWDYGTGQAGDLLSHELDYVQSVLRYGIPDTCMCSGLNTFWKDDREVPDSWIATYQFEKQNCSVTFEGIQNSGRVQPPEFCGRNGRMIYDKIGQGASRFEVYDDGPPQRMGEKPPEPRYQFDPSKAAKWPSHMENFLQCVRTREKPRCDEDEAFIETATLMMSVESYNQRRQVRWDAKHETIV